MEITHVKLIAQSKAKTLISLFNKKNKKDFDNGHWFSTSVNKHNLSALVIIQSLNQQTNGSNSAQTKKNFCLVAITTAKSKQLVKKVD